MRASELFQAIHPTTKLREWPPIHHHPANPSWACDPDTCVPIHPLALLPEAGGRPIDRHKPSPLEFAIGWLHKRTGTPLHDLQNFAERARCGCRWGPLNVKREELEIPTGQFRIGKMPSPGCRVINETLPGIEQVVQKMEELDRRGVMTALLEALWSEYPLELVDFGLPRLCPAKVKPFLPTDLQTGILRALDGKALTAKQLKQILKAQNTLYKRGGIKELVKRGDVERHDRIGYYRPANPPADHAHILSRPLAV